MRVEKCYLSEDPVKPLEGTVEMKLDPTWRARHRLPPVLGPPALHEGHPDGAHPGKRVDCLEAMVN